ncbi:helix-turn-helix transcriptional regulator [Enterobacter bugandensis]|uniref:helix-turn-helix transcriptional regulator n=1 Tax=Enterobacter bugandensis TaxID=881260 RepID=UPI0022E49328|nr:LuxR C-terminal-related transcriptional regulator [Enterobacter bugandensis]
MRRNQRRKAPEMLSLGSALPDNWPGSRYEKGRHFTDGEVECLTPGWIMPDWAHWIRVTVVGRDPWALIGLRHLLARCGAVRLRILKDAPVRSETLADQDLVIWLRLRHDGQQEIARHVAIVRRASSKVRQLVISDAIPQGMRSDRCLLTGVWLANGTANIHEIYDLLSRTMTFRTEYGMFRKKILSAMQWRVLFLRAAGANTGTITALCGISYKTLNTHELAIRAKLGLANRIEYAWMLRAVSQVFSVIPALKRLDNIKTEISV